MKKKILFIIFAVALMTVVLALCVSAGEPVKTWDISNTASGDDVTADLCINEDGTTYKLTLTGTGNMKDWSLDNRAPWWSYRSSITSVMVGEGITELGGYAFTELENLVDVKLPQTLKSVGGACFIRCYSLKHVDLPDAVTALSSYAFSSCTSLVSIKMPSELTKINNYTFSNCTELRSITLPEKLASVGSHAFDNCVELVEINYCATSMSGGDCGDRVFENAGKEAGGITFNVANNVKSIPYGLLDADVADSKIIKIIFEEGSICTTIGTYAFRNNPIERIEFPSSVTTIGKYAFADCTSLEAVVIPSSVATVGEHAFKNCSNAIIFCEASNRPSGWKESWRSEASAEWNYKNLRSKIFTYKGYSTSEYSQQMVVGFEMSTDAIARYELLLNRGVDIGVVFASYERLGGKIPLDSKGNTVRLESGRVIKVSLKEYTYSQYEFILNDITEEYRDHRFVVAAYIANGVETKFVQENGLSDTVSGISYNQATENVVE